MPDITPSQVASPQGPVKSAAKPVEGKPESQPDQRFSKVLHKQMQPEAEANDAGAPETRTGHEVSAARGSEQPDGKSLPSNGNAEDTLIAALNADGQILLETDQLISGMEPSVHPGPLLSAEAGISHSASLPAAMQQSVGLAVSQPAAQQGPQPAAWPAVIPSQLPASAPSPVAQAVQEALSDQDLMALRATPLERFGAETRIQSGLMQRPPGFELLLDRAAPNALQAQTPPATPATLQGGFAPDALAPARPVLPTTTVETPFRQPGWDQALSERVLWASNQRLQSAEIKLNPPQLGPIEVRVQMHQDQAQVSFTAQHASVREALEAALPRLREMFSANGFDLVDVNVSQHSFAEQQRQMQGFATGVRGGGGGAEEGEPAAPAQDLGRASALPRGGVDLFA